MLNIRFTFFFLFLISVSFSQKNEIGISVINYQANKDDSFVIDTAAYSKLKALNSFQPVLTFNHINSKNVDYYIQAGYFYSAGNGFNKATTSSYISYSTAHNLTKSIFLKLGIAKRYYYERVVFSVGVNIPFEFQYSQFQKGEQYYYDTLGITLLEYDNTVDKKSPVYRTGINLNTSVYYNIFNNFYLGIDFNLGITSTITNGKRNYTTTQISYQNNMSQTNSIDLKTKFSYGTGLNFQPIIGIRYCIQKKIKK